MVNPECIGHRVWVRYGENTPECVAGLSCGLTRSNLRQANSARYSILQATSHSAWGELASSRAEVILGSG